MTKYNTSLLCFSFILVLVLSLSCSQDNDSDQQSDSTNPEANIIQEDPEAALNKRLDENQHLQTERKDFIDNMLDAGLASRIENPTGEPYIYVTEPFYLLSKSEQAAMMNVVWHYYITEDRSVDVLTIYDHNTGNEIGTFGRKGLLIVE